MPPEQLLRFTRAQPFRPFRVNLSDRRTFEVRHPDMMMVGYTFIIIGIPQAVVENPLLERSVTVALSDVVSVESLE